MSRRFEVAAGLTIFVAAIAIGCAPAQPPPKTAAQLICDGEAKLADIQRHPPKQAMEFSAEDARQEIARGKQLQQEELERAKARGASSEELAKLEAQSAPRVCKGPGLDANHS